VSKGELTYVFPNDDAVKVCCVDLCVALQMMGTCCSPRDWTGPAQGNFLHPHVTTVAGPQWRVKQERGG